MRSSRSGWAPPLAMLLTAVACALALPACGDDGEDEESPQASDVTLTVGSWGGAFDESLRSAFFDDFESEVGPKARFDAAPGAQLARIEAQNEAGEVEWDLVSLTADAAYILDQKGYLAQLPAQLRSRLTDELGADRVTPFGFSFGNIGNVIVCNMDRMERCPKDMSEFYDVERFPQSRTFAGIAPIMAITTAQVASGVPVSETAETPVDMDAAFEQLDAIKPTIDVFWQSGDQQEQVMRSGGADMGILWSNRAYSLAADGMNLEINWAGGALEPGFWAVPEGAPNTEQSFEALEWIATRPRAQAEWAREVHSSPPHPEAIELLPAELARELADNPRNFEEMAMPNFEWYATHTDELNRRYQDFVRGG
ncbi:MAG TPA: extracellular solute-binding protein [Thermoleophilaceae bacterium]|nr:extracellular solute-binding protein [Thermoleophilaceae bacterium]